MSASGQGERSLQGKSSCEGSLLWLLSERRKKRSFEMEPRGDDAFQLKLGARRPIAGGVLLPFSELKTTRFRRCPPSLSTRVISYSQEETGVLVRGDGSLFGCEQHRLIFQKMLNEKLKGKRRKPAAETFAATVRSEVAETSPLAPHGTAGSGTPSQKPSVVPFNENPG